MKELSAEELLPKLPNLEINEQEKVVTFASFQKRAKSAIQELVYTDKANPIMLLTTNSGIDVENCIRDLINQADKPPRKLYDICYAENLANELSPTWLHIKSGTAEEFNTLICDLLNKIKHNLNAEEVLLKILRKQDNNQKLENYLSDLSIHVAQGKDFTHPVLMNLLVCHEKAEAPIIFGRDLTWKGLFGGVNYLTENGTTYSHHHLLEAGLLRKADGGFLVLPIDEIIRNPLLWFKLKNTLAKGTIDWENPTEIPGAVVPFFAPEPTPVNVRVILTGSLMDIADLYNYDPEASAAVYLRTDLNSYFKLSDQYANFKAYLHTLAHNRQLLPFEAEAIDRLVRFSCRNAESQNEFLIEEHKLCSLMREASGRAKRKNLKAVDLETINESFEEQNFRSNSIVDESSDYYLNKQMLIKTDGEVVGQINGLSVVQTFGDDFEYGEPIRITATIHSGGDGDIADIEHKAELAGQIHTKAMMIINGYLTNKFASEDPLPVSANLVFEQSYSEIDGDSASLTGLCAILSALADQPIRQQFSVTGAVDQLGNVQPVGGLNEKIEGFYRICRIQGLTGKQGVIIPESNSQSLILSDEVVNQVKAGKFHIYTVATVDEAIELLTGVEAGLADEEEEKENSESSEAKEKTTLKAEVEDDDEESYNLYELICDYLDKIQEHDRTIKTGLIKSLWRKIFG